MLVFLSSASDVFTFYISVTSLVQANGITMRRNAIRIKRMIRLLIVGPPAESSIGKGMYSKSLGWVHELLKTG
jgi:hypothetical protein